MSYLHLKKNYSTPRVEVLNVQLSQAVFTGSLPNVPVEKW